MRVPRFNGWFTCVGAALLLVAAQALVPSHRPALASARSTEPHTSPQPPLAGVTPPHGRLTIVGLGDSVVSGSHCVCAPFITRYGAMAAHATHHATQVRNLGVPGWTTSDLVSALRPGGKVARRLPGADIVTITIGANDMSRARNEWAHDECVDCFARVAASVRTNVAEIIRLVRARVGTRPLEVLVTTYWNVFKEPPAAGRDDPDGPGYVEMAELATSRANHAICAAAKQRHAACVDLYRPFKGAHGGRDATGLLAPDRDHPDAAGHQLIASTLAAYGWRELGLPVVQHRS